MTQKILHLDLCSIENRTTRVANKLNVKRDLNHARGAVNLLRGPYPHPNLQLTEGTGFKLVLEVNDIGARAEDVIGHGGGTVGMDFANGIDDPHGEHGLESREAPVLQTTTCPVLSNAVRDDKAGWEMDGLLVVGGARAVLQHGLAGDELAVLPHGLEGCDLLGSSVDLAHDAGVSVHVGGVHLAFNDGVVNRSRLDGEKLGDDNGAFFDLGLADLSAVAIALTVSLDAALVLFGGVTEIVS
mmetsp:Transcript_25733/g.55371  ORF Transcript_25733/g.55371 Transcript_25733/m.55371 type:complete len:242 (+) Transcript_25733:763-1488(+)